MRTTIDIEDDLLAFARQEADRNRKSIGAIVSSMMRKGLELPTPSERSPRTGILMLPHRPDGGPVTMEMVDRLRDELD